MKNPFDNLPASDEEDNSKFVQVDKKKGKNTLIQMPHRRNPLSNSPKHLSLQRKPETIEPMLMIISLLTKEKTPKVIRVTKNKDLIRKSLIIEFMTEKVEQVECINFS